MSIGDFAFPAATGSTNSTRFLTYKLGHASFHSAAIGPVTHRPDRVPSPMLPRSADSSSSRALDNVSLPSIHEMFPETLMHISREDTGATAHQKEPVTTAMDIPGASHRMNTCSSAGQATYAQIQAGGDLPQASQPRHSSSLQLLNHDRRRERAGGYYLAPNPGSNSVAGPSYAAPSAAGSGYAIPARPGGSSSNTLSPSYASSSSLSSYSSSPESPLDNQINPRYHAPRMHYSTVLQPTGGGVPIAGSSTTRISPSRYDDPADASDGEDPWTDGNVPADPWADAAGEPPNNSGDPTKRHVCRMCFKRFNRPSSLRIHLNTHTGATPFRCPWPDCGREFNVNSNMRRHYRNHTHPGLSRPPPRRGRGPQGNTPPPQNSASRTGHSPSQQNASLYPDHAPRSQTLAYSTGLPNSPQISVSRDSSETDDRENMFSQASYRNQHVAYDHRGLPFIPSSSSDYSMQQAPSSSTSSYYINPYT